MTPVAYIYTLSDPRTEEVRYVGKAFNLIKRLRTHISAAKKETTRKANWIKSLIKAGLKPEIKELEAIFINEVKAWEDAETFWIESLRFLGCRLTNGTVGGKLGASPSKEVRDKIARWHKGRKRSPEARANMAKAHDDYVFTEAHRKAIAKANTGRIPSAQAYANMRGKKRSEAFKAKMRGRKASPETIAKIRLSLLGRKCSPQHKINVSKGRWKNKSKYNNLQLAFEL